MNFNTYFRLTSYATVAAAALALFVAGGVGAWLSVAFALVMIAAWKLEDTRGQLSERIALGVILVSLPIFYLDWRILTPYLQIEFLETGQRANAEVAVLAHLIQQQLAAVTDHRLQIGQRLVQVGGGRRARDIGVAAGEQRSGRRVPPPW